MWAKRKDSGFTIVELLIVIVVIGVLAAIVIISYTGVTNGAKDAEREAELNSIQKALSRYSAEGGTWPICTNTVQTCLGAILVPTYLPAIPTDPVNTGSHVYRYAGGYRKNGTALSYTNTGSTSDYILGVRGESGGAVYSGWGFNDLTMLVGS